MSPQLREFIRHVIVPALVEEWLEEHPEAGGDVSRADARLPQADPDPKDEEARA